jgi:multiple sugar transport system substrate-binding protein
VEIYVRADQLVCLDDFQDFDSLCTGRFMPDVIRQARSRNGKTYQILWKTNPIMLLYNKKMFREAGFDRPPETYTEYLTAAQRMSKDLDGDGYVDQWVGISDIRARWRDRLFDFYPLYIAASGGATLIEKGSIVFDNESAVEVFRFFQTIYRNEYFPKEISAGRKDPFLSEEAASRIVGPWEIAHTEKFKPEGFEYDFTHVPVPESTPGPNYTYGDMKSIVIFKNTRYPEEAWEFVKFMISRENDLKLLRYATQLPLRKNLLKDPIYREYFQNHPRMTDFAEQAQYIKGLDQNPALKEIFDAISQEFEACVVYSAKEPEQAVQDAAERARLVLE